MSLEGHKTVQDCCLGKENFNYTIREDQRQFCNTIVGYYQLREREYQSGNFVPLQYGMASKVTLLTFSNTKLMLK